MSNIYDCRVPLTDEEREQSGPWTPGHTLRLFLGGHKTPEEWQAYYAEKVKEKIVVVSTDEDGNQIEEVRTSSGRRPRGSVRKAFDPDELKDVLAEFDGGMKPLDIAAKRNVQPPVVYTFLKAEGREIKRGRKPGQIIMKADGTAAKPLGRQRSTRLEMSTEEIDEAVASFHAGKGMVALAQEYNVPPPLMKEYLSAKGCVIKKGKRKVGGIEPLIDLDTPTQSVVA